MTFLLNLEFLHCNFKAWHFNEPTLSVQIDVGGSRYETKGDSRFQSKINQPNVDETK